MTGFAGFPIAPQSQSQFQLASSSPLPSYLARHANLGFDNDDVVALISSIDASQRYSTGSASQLPAELLLQILEYIPVDYVLDWRLVCRGFRDAIDGQIMFKHLQRTQLIGYIGERDADPMNSLSDENYDRLHLLRANFMHLDYRPSNNDAADRVSPAWTGTHAVFEIEERWYEACRNITGAKAQNGYALMDITPRWMDALERLELQLPEEGYGSLRWCIKLDHAVLDLDIPLEVGKTSFDVAIDLSTKTIRVAWKKMLFRFLRTENALRKLMHKTMHSNFTFSYLGDCLRAVRRARLFAALDPNDKLDRHLIWSMRLLHPLFGLPCHNHNVALSHVENNAVDVLMLLRREAAMTDQQIIYLRQLNEDRVAMERQLIELEEQFREFKGHMSAPGYVFTLPLSTTVDSALPHNPIAWPDDMRASIEDRVGKWRDQKKVIAQLHTLLSASNQALGVPQNSFDLLSSDLSFAL